MDEHVVFIGNGEGTINLVDGIYNVTSETYGYDNDTLNPTTQEITSTTEECSFSLSASGTLMIYAYDGGSGRGKQIVGATFYRCDEDVNTYGEPVITDSTGFAYLRNVPYHERYPQPIYYVQTASDGTHSFSTEIRSRYMSESEDADLIINPEIT